MVVIVLLAVYYFVRAVADPACAGGAAAGGQDRDCARLLIIPLGFAMGMPFPSGLRMLGEARGDDNLDRVGVGDECGVERAGVGAVDDDCHSVWAAGHF